jgi:hypothetical protein
MQRVEKTMKKQKSIYTIISLLILLFLFYQPILHAQQDQSKPLIILISPEEGSTISNNLPEIKIEYEDINGIDTDTIELKINNFDVSDWEETKITQTNITYNPPDFLPFKDGNHTITIRVSNLLGETTTQSYRFAVNTSLPTIGELSRFDIFSLIQTIIIITILAFTIFALYIFYLKKTKKFTFKKYFAQHQIDPDIFILYIPLIISFLFTILGLAIASNTADMAEYSMEYIIVAGVFIAILPYAIYTQIQRKTTEKYERAFSQFLFEMADAMRGGLDPTKAIIELAKTETGMLSKHLKRAADAIKIGRPFDEIVSAMVRNIKSNLIQRYAVLIGETSKVGGETSQVIHRTAKDMDDFIKVYHERRRQLLGQSFIIYIAFVVLLIVLYQLLLMFPGLEGMDASLIGSSGLDAAASQKTLTRMDFFTIKQRFFHLVLVNALGTGTIIGMFVDGNIKYGLMHSLILLVVTIVFFTVLIL